MYSIIRLGLYIAILTCCSKSVFAQIDLQPVPNDFQYCTVCHGAQLGGSSGTNAPRLSHLPDWYIENQLAAFKHLRRGGNQSDKYGNEMRIGTEGVAFEKIRDASIYASSTASSVPQKTVDGDIEQGRQLFVTCSVCHGQKGEGNKAMHGPPLAGSNDWYLVRQLQNFKHGYRGTAPDDVQGNIMRASTAVLTSDQAINDVVAYIQFLTQQ